MGFRFGLAVFTENFLLQNRKWAQEVPEACFLQQIFAESNINTYTENKS